MNPKSLNELRQALASAINEQRALKSLVKSLFEPFIAEHRDFNRNKSTFRSCNKLIPDFCEARGIWWFRKDFGGPGYHAATIDEKDVLAGIRRLNKGGLESALALEPVLAMYRPHLKKSSEKVSRLKRELKALSKSSRRRRVSS